MTNKILDEYLERLRAALASLPGDERDAIIAETRAHLDEAIAARMATEPDAEIGRVSLEETSAFGEPAEIAEARGAMPSHATERRGSRWPRWATYALAVALLLTATVVAIDIIDKPTQYVAYQRDNVLETHTATLNDSFDVRPGTQTLAISFIVERQGGCAGLRVLDPTGEVVFDMWDACSDVSRSVELKAELAGRAGAWQVELRYRDFTGEIVVHSRGTLS